MQIEGKLLGKEEGRRRITLSGLELTCQKKKPEIDAQFESCSIFVIGWLRSLDTSLFKEADILIAI